jgi:glutamine amidotransferase
MCELFGLSAGRPVSFTCSLDRFAAHGSLEGPNHDGWGVAAYEGGDARIIKEPAAAAQSEWVRFIEQHGVSSPLVIAHIRRASEGGRSLVNTHPFDRELGGRRHLFAHNGLLPDIRVGFCPLRQFHPIGETDSEYAFCVLLDRLTGLWADMERPSAASRRALVAEFAAELALLGPANFIYSDGELLFAYGDQRQHDTGVVAPPGLHLLQRRVMPDDQALGASGVDVSGPDQAVCILASVPLTDEPWRPLAQGELLMISSGRVVDSSLASGGSSALTGPSSPS